jgi:microcystin degradation protein MlrC
VKIAVGGFQHETNTFAPTKADLSAFVDGGGWPALSRGEEIFSSTNGVNLPIAGFTDEARALGHQLVPTAWAAASPSAQVTREAYETIAGYIVEGIRAAGGIDGVYLDLHGAMVTEHYQDGEGELLRRLRDLLGREMPIVASLDLHANVTPEMAGLADALVAYRTYPHVDMAVTGARAMRLLQGLMQGRKPHKAMRQIPFLLPLTSGCSLIEPAAGLYDLVGALEERGVTSTSFAAGFAPADIWHAGPSVMAFGENDAETERAADALAEAVLAAESRFGGDILSAEDAVAEAMRVAASARRPVVLADTQDNPGAGGNGDTVGLLAELVRQKAQGAVLGVLIDAASAAQATEAGEGAQLEMALGAVSGIPGHRPLRVRATVKRLGNGRFTCTGPFYKGSRMQLGPMALLDVDGVEVALASRKAQAADQEMFRHLGIEPSERRILALKSSVHFRADFQPIAEQVIVAAAPGPNPVDHRKLDYKNLRPGVRLMPGGPVSGALSP